MVNWMLALLAGVGLYISTYFTLVAYRAIPPSVRWMPQVCQLQERSCGAIVWTRQARLLGLPNSLLGMVWYLLVWLGAAGAVPAAWLLAPAAATVLMGAVLTYQLLRVLRVPCPLCFVSHGINLAILLLIAAR